MTYAVAGIDPGKSGGYAIFDRRSRKLLDAGPLIFEAPSDLFDALEYFKVEEVLIERAQGARDQANQFEYGRGFGRTEAACMMTGAKIYYCAPAWWKGKLFVPVDKKEAIERAHQLIDGLDKFVWLQKHNGIAEAALIGSILLDRKLTEALIANNVKREKPKRKRTSFRL